MSRLKKKYREEGRAALQEQFQYRNPMMMPAMKKVVISMGLAEAQKDKNDLQACLNELTWLSGQKPIVTKSRTSIANFKLRKGQVIGAKVTLRGKRMYDFIDRFINIAAPRIRDFRGFSPKGDGRGSYSLGIEDQQIFAEIKLDLVKRVQGMNITFVTSAQTDEEALALLKHLGMPFKEKVTLT